MIAASVTVEGIPRLEVTLEMEDEHGDHAVGGVILTATRLVNAIPAVVAAPEADACGTSSRVARIGGSAAATTSGSAAAAAGSAGRADPPVPVADAGEPRVVERAVASVEGHDGQPADQHHGDGAAGGSRHDERHRHGGSCPCP